MFSILIDCTAPFMVRFKTDAVEDLNLASPTVTASRGKTLSETVRIVFDYVF